MDRHVVRRLLHKQLDLEMKQAKQAEARLGQHLQRLQAAHLCQLRQLTREQRQLERQLQRLQQDIKEKCASNSRSGIQRKPGDTPTRPLQGGTPGIPRATGVRTQATNTTQEGHKTRSQVSPAQHTGLKDPTPSKEEPPSPSCTTPRFTEEKPAFPATRADAADPGPTASPVGGWGAARGDEATPGDTCLQPGLSPGCADGPHSQSLVPTFPELFARAAHAHYLRHRVLPESERLLSISEIFGHGDPATQDRPPSQSPPL
ncbi:coiled-coil domain-containing protein 190 isoform X2 [Saccopteryx leptura]|uniref:coiled-coil domain-containing protein 190 isoform X2 n=1 Tax=Saccopteryx leptura TaxID=249018 RepID=UPI00339BAB50